MNIITNVVMSCVFFVLVMLSLANTVNAYSGGKDATVAKENKVEKAVNKIKNVKVKDVTISGEFAGVTYVYSDSARNDEDAIRIVTANMPKVLEAVFSVKGIERARIKAFFPAQDGGDKKIAT